MNSLDTIAESMLNDAATSLPAGTPAYAASFTATGESRLAMARVHDEDVIIVAGRGPAMDDFSGTQMNNYKLCPCDTGNRPALYRHAPFTRPVTSPADRPSIGLGDRLGIATPGHIAAVSGRPVFPVFAQQSMRELALTGRSMDDILDSAAFAVFRGGYREGYGADADHIKKEDDIAAALRLGFSMITLDCSDHINNHARGLSGDRLAAECREKTSPAIMDLISREYTNREITAGDFHFNISPRDAARCFLIYGAALDFIERIYRSLIASAGRPVDFEISIDETDSATEPLEHLFIALELSRRGVSVRSVAPRFTGEFQKGIDYRGDIARFGKDIIRHAAIARAYGYRLSIHSGSDKFSVFPLIGKHTGGIFHVKTAGTNWLEALRVISVHRPDLYRRMHRYALDNFAEACRYYHVSADPGRLTPPEDTPDSGLPSYLDDDDARQLMHITYGLLLSARDSKGSPVFRDELYRALRDYGDAYERGLRGHIGRHLDLLGVNYI